MIINYNRHQEKGLLFFLLPFYSTNIELRFTVMRPVPYKKKWPAGFVSCLAVMDTLLESRAILIIRHTNNFCLSLYAPASSKQEDSNV